ncbi:MAG: 50S ribosomal protein L25/general stress protein Ctc [Proteobacteria bacterium]|nr:50S ribosomal protein L25/general stress protein Ctc [Pseudomonadota bacterium]
MRITFELDAEFREMQGKGASRRLRHAGKVPAILYGGHLEPRQLAFNHQKLMTLVENEKLYSSIISINVGEEKQPVIIKDMQMHPAKSRVVHMDLQRVLENEVIRIHLPIHFKGEAAAPGVKTQGGVLAHRMSDVEVVCLPADLPEYLELDLTEMNINESKHLSDLPLPKGVTIPALAKTDSVVVSIHSPRAEEPEAVAAAAEGAVAAPAAGAVGAAAAPAAAAGDAKKDAGKKDAAKK